MPVQQIAVRLGRWMVGAYCLCAVPLSAAEDVALTDRCSVHFATVDEARALLTADDALTRSFSRFDLQVRLQTTGAVDLEAWRRSVAACVRPWPADEVVRLSTAVAALRTKLRGYQLPLPREVILIHTDGRDESNAAYTRGAAIVLPPRMLRRSPEALQELLLHELFHVLSRNDEALRKELYQTIGFEVCPPIPLPEPLAATKISNPDAPIVDCTIKLQIDGREVVAAPLLFAKPGQFDPKFGGSLFNYLTFRLLVVEAADDGWRPKLVDGEPQLLDPDKLDSFQQQIGRNTQYIIHPDEILADNFVALVMGRQNLPTPRIIAAMAKLLSPESGR